MIEKSTINLLSRLFPCFILILTGFTGCVCPQHSRPGVFSEVGNNYSFIDQLPPNVPRGYVKFCMTGSRPYSMPTTSECLFSPLGPELDWSYFRSVMWAANPGLNSYTLYVGEPCQPERYYNQAALQVPVQEDCVTVVNVSLEDHGGLYMNLELGETYPIKDEPKDSFLDNIRRAKTNWGICYEKGYYEKINYAKAAQFYRKAADLGEGKGQYNLGVLYEKGLGVPQNDVEAVQWFRKAASAGPMYRHTNYPLGWFILAHYKLGCCAEKGKGMHQDYTLAAHYFETAARTGHPEANYKLTEFYEKGLGVPKDQAAATYFLNQAKQAELKVAREIKNHPEPPSGKTPFVPKY